MRTFFISTKESTGSAFSIEFEEKYQFLITAKHVLDCIEFENGDTIQFEIFHNENWEKISCIAMLHENPDIDIVVLNPIETQFKILPIKFGLEDLYLGNDIYFLGFPYGMYTPSAGNVNYKYPIPFVKKGVLSSIISENNITEIFIDAHNNNGFSGGPVITVGTENQVQIVGVNVSYIKHENIVPYDESDVDGNVYENLFEYYENSGIMKAQGINHAIEIIKQNL